MSSLNVVVFKYNCANIGFWTRNISLAVLLLHRFWCRTGALSSFSLPEVQEPSQVYGYEDCNQD